MSDSSFILAKEFQTTVWKAEKNYRNFARVSEIAYTENSEMLYSH